MTWSEYDERYGESREDFLEAEEEDVERCSYCGGSASITRRAFRVDNQIKTEPICSACLAEELPDQSPSREPARVA
jgi:superfamily II helicase